MSITVVPLWSGKVGDHLHMVGLAGKEPPVFNHFKHSTQPACDAALKFSSYESVQIFSHSSKAIVPSSYGNLPCSLTCRRNSKARGKTRRWFLRFESSRVLLWCLLGYCQGRIGRVPKIRLQQILVLASSRKWWEACYISEPFRCEGSF